MTISVRRSIGAGALGAALLAACIMPASANDARQGGLAQAAAQAASTAYPGESYTQYYGGRRGYYGRGYGRGYRRGPGGGAIAAGVIGGLALGAL
ncbi:MAG: hypothetical protein JWR08_659, partial [Enterovirga sp.]|nr:hypothetical protein [Enterovirga sp.]